MIALPCQHAFTQKFGKDKYGRQRRRCKTCGKVLVDRDRTLGDMRIGFDIAEMAIKLLCEGCSIRSTERLTGLHRDTLCKLVLQLGSRFQQFMRFSLRDLKLAEISIDEAWAFVRMKRRTVLNKGCSDRTIGDCYLFSALCRNTKLVCAHAVGKRDSETVIRMLSDLAHAVSGRFQLSSDAYEGIVGSVVHTLRGRVDYGIVIKHFKTGPQTNEAAERYSPTTIVSMEKSVIVGKPDHDRISTSHSERLHLDYRMGMRRFTRLSNAFSKSWRHHEAMCSLWIAYFNYVRRHGTIKTTPAVAAGVCDKPWSIRRLLEESAWLG